jgi:predicted GNAT family acetyltransferase
VLEREYLQLNKDTFMNSENSILGNQLVVMSRADLDALVEKMASNLIAMRVEAEDKTSRGNDVCPVVYNAYLCAMFVRKKRNRTGTISVVVVDKRHGFKEVTSECKQSAHSSSCGRVRREEMKVSWHKTAPCLFDSHLHRTNKVAGSIFVCYFIVTTSLFLR